MTRILIACEKSGRVRDAFIKQGYNAISCDLLESDSPGPHIIGDVSNYLNDNWDMIIAFPPCTYLCSSGLHWNKRRPERQKETDKAIQFVLKILTAKCNKIAIENPVGCLSTFIRKPDQIIQPWQFGEPESKKTCLWLRNLPLLKPTNILPYQKRWNNQTVSGQNKLGPSKNRAELRGITYMGIATAMSLQWQP